ncbi:hypothetical protein F2Q69_00053399 [Brassica cretica]|uniref:Uncharacterized protein n=1 Tax=Brassica cretica TaxID=69181 RepID=A0A8S9N5F6_BRACR|nr:hypothetical protein F2Q69_00053399 [Brassica cretica]
MLTHEQSRCPALAKEDIESFMVGGSDGDGAGATSCKAVVANDTKQLGERREAHYNRSQAGRGGDKGKGLVRESQGAYRQEGSFHPYKGKHPRGYGDGASYQGRYTGYGDRRIGSLHKPLPRATINRGDCFEDIEKKESMNPLLRMMEDQIFDTHRNFIRDLASILLTIAIFRSKGSESNLLLGLVSLPSASFLRFMD